MIITNDFFLLMCFYVFYLLFHLRKLDNVNLSEMSKG